MVRTHRKTLNVVELMVALNELLRKDPGNGAKLVWSTSECGYVHEGVAGVEKVTETHVILSEAND